MEKYENVGVLGEGSYGMVMKCRHKETKQVVAIKKFLETEDDKVVRKIALREVKMLKQVRHENLINLLEVFRRKRRLYLVFEFVDHTALDELERFPNGAEESYVKKIMWQVLKGVEFCHLHNVIHRDVKPENILISKRGVVKLCDFGFARTIAPPGEVYTDYVATRWYRAPELLVGDTCYGRAVDVWAIGCMFSEMLTGEPLFPGESDIDQLHLIMKCFGNLIGHHREIFRRNPLFIGMRLPEAREVESLDRRYHQLSHSSMDIVKWALRLDPSDRPSCSQLLRHELFTRNGWIPKFTAELRVNIEKEFAENPLLNNLGIAIYGSVHEAKLREIAEKKGTSGSGTSTLWG
ncbi:Cyclin-dependent kinase-like 2 [Geodia barretti]|uniref:cyclin-dependent kinase n=2 Tax=Geodia barretti TaxID=519541 RepID=A0AA35WXA3_GEOBA|nr:Cyclin-dependent kinase-like 2 [Geodia barretti]